MTYIFMRAWRAGRKTRLAGLLGGPLVALIYVLVSGINKGDLDPYSAPPLLNARILALLIILFAFLTEAFLSLPRIRDREKMFFLTPLDGRSALIGLYLYVFIYAILSLVLGVMTILLISYIEGGGLGLKSSFEIFNRPETLTIFVALLIQTVFAISLLFFVQLLYYYLLQKMAWSGQGLSVISIFINALTLLIFWSLGTYINNIINSRISLFISADSFSLVSALGRGDMLMGRLLWLVPESLSMGIWQGWSLISLVYMGALIFFNFTGSVSIMEDKMDW